MTPLEVEIRQRIESEGPLSIADFMALCLTHPTHGYYTTGHPVGGRASASREGGDFITAPEISQMFGEMIGVWCMEVWQALGCPKPFTLAEIGPGRGTLMADLLRVAGALPEFAAAADIHLVEISPTLAEQQSLTLSKDAARIKWIRDISALPDQPTIIIANELLDALPFRQWMKIEGRWIERAVGLKDDQLHFVTRPSSLDEAELPTGYAACADGTIFETSAPRESLVATIANHLNTQNGAALFIDYGHLKSGFGDTFQAMKDHGFVSPLEQLGDADLTSHVDFEPLLVAAKENNCTAPTPTTQGNFLLSLGLLERAGNLGHGRDKQVQENLQIAVNRLVAPEQMGDLFKVMAFGAPLSLGERWPGFEGD